VNAKVIKEVVPLPEPFVAVLVITFEDLNMSLASWVLISEDSEFFRIWNKRLDLYSSQVEGAAGLNSDNDISVDLLEGFADITKSVGSHFLFGRVNFDTRIWSP